MAEVFLGSRRPRRTSGVRGEGTIAGRTAAVPPGAKRIDDFTPVAIIGPFHRPPPGIVVRRERIAAELTWWRSTAIAAGLEADLEWPHPPTTQVGSVR